MINADAIILKDLLTSGVFRPAIVQREYQWTTKEAGILLDDLFGAFQDLGLDPQIDDLEAFGEDNKPLLQATSTRLTSSPVYNLNLFVLFRAQKSSKIYYVYDGLQRLTTLTLLFSALRNRIPPEHQAVTLIRTLLYDDFDKPKPENTRLLFPTRAGALKSIVNQTKTNYANRTTSDLRMHDISERLKGRTETWSPDRCAAFLDFACNKIMCTRQIITNRSLAYQTFITTNNRGLKLNIADIVKGQIIERHSELGGTVASAQKIEKEWRGIRELIHSGGMPTLMSAAEDYLFGLAPRAKVGERLLNHVQDFSNADEIEIWVSNEFQKIVAAFSQTRRYLLGGNISGVDVHFYELSFLSWNDWYPVAVALILHNKGDENDLAVKISQLKRACYIMEILDWGQGRTNRLADAIEDIKKGQDPFKVDYDKKIMVALHFLETSKMPLETTLRDRSTMTAGVVRLCVGWKPPFGLEIFHAKLLIAERLNTYYRALSLKSGR